MSNGSKAPVGKAARHDGEYGAPLAVGAFCAVFHPGTVRDSALLRRVFQGDQVRRSIGIIPSGRAIKTLKISDVESMAIVGHALSERARTADVRDAIDSAILAADAVLARLMPVRQGLVHDMAKLGLNEKGEIRRTDQAEDIHATELGALPVSWGVDSKGRMANDLALGTAAQGAKDGKDRPRLLKMAISAGMPWTRQSAKCLT